MSSVLDATTYADYKTFASNQTGNTILLAVSALGNTEVLIVMTAISLGTFLTFAGIFGHLGHFMGEPSPEHPTSDHICFLHSRHKS